MNTRLKSKTNYLYFLSYDLTDQIFYIGITTNPASRYKNHCLKHGREITMTVFKELNCDFPASIESFVIKKAINNGFVLKNNVKCLVPEIEGEESDISFDCFKKSSSNFHDFDFYDGVRLYPDIDNSALKIKTHIKEQVTLLSEESDRLEQEAKRQCRSKSNLARIYILEGLKIDELKNTNDL